MTAPQPLTMRAIADEICARHNVTLAELVSHDRTRRVSQPRYEFMWRARQVFRSDGLHRFSFPKIGQFLGGRHHTTILLGARRYAEWGGRA